MSTRRYRRLIIAEDFLAKILGLPPDVTIMTVAQSPDNKLAGVLTLDLAGPHFDALPPGAIPASKYVIPPRQPVTWQELANHFRSYLDLPPLSEDEAEPRRQRSIDLDG